MFITRATNKFYRRSLFMTLHFFWPHGQETSTAFYSYFAIADPSTDPVQRNQCVTGKQKRMIFNGLGLFSKESSYIA